MTHRKEKHEENIKICKLFEKRKLHLQWQVLVFSTKNYKKKRDNSKSEMKKSFNNEIDKEENGKI